MSLMLPATPLLIAMRDLHAGVFEIPGRENHYRILEYHGYTELEAKKDEVSWCSAAVCAWHEESDIESTRSAAARSWLEWGVAVDRMDARPGDVVVEWRVSPGAWQGHVYLLADWPTNPLNLTGVGGNQREGGVDCVCIRERLVDKVLGIRRFDGGG